MKENDSKQDDIIQEVCLFKGFSKDQASQAMNILSAGGGKFQSSFYPMTENMLDTKVEPLLEKLFNKEWISDSVLREGHRVVIMAVSGKERAVTVMHAVKAVSEDPQDIVFAMVTQTALGWTLGEYIDHVSKEHEYMKTHNPADDPDMKPV